MLCIVDYACIQKVSLRFQRIYYKGRNHFKMDLKGCPWLCSQSLCYSVITLEAEGLGYNINHSQIAVHSCLVLSNISIYYLALWSKSENYPRENIGMICIDDKY